MKRRVTDRAVLRFLKRHGFDVEALRVSLADRDMQASVQTDRYVLTECGSEFQLQELRVITQKPAVAS